MIVSTTRSHPWAAVLVLLVLKTDFIVWGEILTPPYFNLAEGKPISATATCGVDTEGPELYCKLIGANADSELNINVIQGQYCDFCDPTQPNKMHPPEFAVDGLETWWQSPPLSRGMKYNEVNLTIELGQEFHVAYVYIRMANSPRPGLWILEKSADYGKTYTPWQYFSDSPTDCETYFGKESLNPITRDDSVICTTEYSKIVPLEGGEIPVSLLNKRPSAGHYFNSTVLQEWTRATNVRLRFLRTKNLLGHLMSVARQDPSVTRRYFYSIKDISIGGRCMCNGHAQTCDIPDPQDHKILLCRCRHNTCGAKCEFCCPGFEQKAWRQSKHNNPFQCEPCNCFSHSNECIYDEEIDMKHLSLDIHGKYEGGGVCQNCQHNTESINCNKCKATFYRPYSKHWNETDVCQPCDCNRFYSTGNCAEGSGRCECRQEFQPPNCDRCSFGYYDYPNCKPCECFPNGTQNQQCSILGGDCTCLYNFGGQYCKECAPGFFNFPKCERCQCDISGALSDACEQENGTCTCKSNFSGKHCDKCTDGYYEYPNCKYCNCDTSGTEEGICNKDTGQCLCKEGYGGERCDICILGFYGYPDCKPCNCSKKGSHGSTCSPNGKCSCLNNYAGRTCNQCSPGYFNYPECTPCECNSHGSNGLSCDSEGKCECHENFASLKCDECKEGYYNYPACEDCNCHPAGVVEGFAGCGSVPAGELCQCKERVEGRICNKCKALYWNLSPHNPDGCEECTCNKAGVLGGLAVCETENGQCVCKPSVVTRACSECADGTYNLDERNLFGCTDCGCDIGGSVNSICDKKSGQCLCQSRVSGRTCNEPLTAHYFPTLYQYQYEVEDGRTIENTRVRYGHNENIFPNYSWKGYAIYSPLQMEVLQDIYIYKPSLYRMVLRYVNLNKHPIIGNIKITPDNPNDNEQWFKVQFINTTHPAFVTVSGDSGNTPSPFVMNPGKWSINIRVNESIFLDYFVLLPEDFYLATILNQKVEKPCTVDEMDLCRDFAYPNITIFGSVSGVGGYVQNGKRTSQLREFFQEASHLAKINVGNKVPMLNVVQPDITFNLTVFKSGSYVIVVNYVTPLTDLRTHKVDVISKTDPQHGTLHLYSCPYTTMCRQTVTSDQGGIAVYNISKNYITVDLKSDNADVGIHSIYAVPYQDWSLDFIKPKPKCIRKNGTCVPSFFPTPPETKKIQFEQEMEGELGKNRPEIKMYNDTTYIWLNPSESTFDLKGKVPYPGWYTFVVQFHQPHYPEFNVDVILQNGQYYEAKVPVKHCPSESGCRAVIVQSDRNNKFLLNENFMSTFKGPDNRNVFLDYLLVIPTDLYHDRYLEEENFVRAGEFISTCGSNHFNIDTTQEGFCRNSVYSITAGHNSGALPCQCDFDGSLSFECDKFGGQCKCRDNIIGRKCEACKTGYYGFPECKPCNCPSTAYCDPNNGQCICPAHVTGERCDQCERFTYGYDPIIGCVECRCNILGVAYSRECDLNNGSCSCKPNIVGRTCDTCRAGYFGFPNCAFCECDNRGTTVDICDQDTAECFCKKNAIGPRCEFCREGTFNLQADNEDGCTECFCFGKTTRCKSSHLVKVSLMEMTDWDLVFINGTNELDVVPSNMSVYMQNNVVGGDFSNVDVSNVSAYFSAPPDYLGKKLTSYGGFLNYTIFYVIGEEGSAILGPDVILRGANTFLTYFGYEQPPPSQAFSASLQLVESNFEMPSGVPAKRDHIMDVLNNLRGVYIRATYWSPSITSRIENIIMDEAIEYTHETRNPILATTVEHCQCPPGYQGYSCEECAPGYYRTQTGPHGGYCVPCDCHGHAQECDLNTGLCLNCTHNTRGDHCELCEVGYHGNALAGTPMDCLICACPLPVASNNFATACDLSSDGEKISCECKEGYFGGKCQACAPGFYGHPDILGNYCKPCQCSGNINIEEDPGSCDTNTGECLKCLNNTFGHACALCAPGYFGDAVSLKDCQACICDEFGTDHCNSHSGECVCKPNVVGEKCDRCRLEHYGFQSGRGCTPCDCAEASDSDQCDDATGQCKCKPGVTGRACDRCAAGYWNYTLEGCVSCGCKSEYSLGLGCNAHTGQCECLEGVIGEKCDQCPYRWAFVPDYGCHQCDNCTHALLDVTDDLDIMIDPIIMEFDSTQSGYFTRRRLENMRELLEQLGPKFDDVDPKQISLEDQIQELEGLEQDSKNLNRKSNYSLENSDSLNSNATDLKDKAEILDYEASTVEADSLAQIDDIQRIGAQLSEGRGSEVEMALQEAQQILAAIKLYNLTDREEEADKQLDTVDELLQNATEFKLPVDTLKEEVDALRGNLKDFNDKLDDLYNHTQYSLNMANEADKIIQKSGKDLLKTKVANIDSQVAQGKDNLMKAEYLLSNASDLLEISLGKLKSLKDLPSTLESRNNDFNSTLENNSQEIEEIQQILPAVKEHATTLTMRAEELDSLLTETRDVSSDAVKAASAYKDIIEAVKNAQLAANEAQNNTNNAVDILEGVKDKTFGAEQNSSKSLEDAYELYHSTSDDLIPRLEEAKENHIPIKQTHDMNVVLLKEIERILNDIKGKPVDFHYKNATENAEKATEFVVHTENVVNTSFTELPKETAQAKLLPKDVDDTRRNILQTGEQINSVNDKLPPVIESLNELPAKQAAIKREAEGIQTKINKLSQQIELARDLANRIKVGVKFYPNTTLELANPPNLEELSTSLRVSGYFRTNSTDGLLWYLGNPVGTNLRRANKDDYMALIIQNGYPVLKLDIGNGPDQLISEKYVSDNVWYQFIIERVGHHAKLTIREETTDGKEVLSTVEKPLTGPLTIFNLDKEKSKLFVGSFPVNYEMQEDILFNSFDGEIEDLVIGDKPVSLWNFNNGYENNHGAIERDKLVVLQRSTGYRFNGNGYSYLNARSYSLRQRSDIQMMFKTFAADGLLFLAGNGSTFISIEMRGGNVLYQYNLGHGTKKWPTSKKYNDGQWHKISASREGHRGRFSVDNEIVQERSIPIQGTTLEINDTVSFGGYPGLHHYKDVTETKFDGCINNVTIMGHPVDLSVNIKAYDVTPGCPNKVAPMVSFEKYMPGYVIFDRLSINNDFQASLKFKTKEKDGLIFYVTDDQQTAGISLSLADGHLKVISQMNEHISKDTFNDNEWHVVSVMHNDKGLRVDFDDFGSKVTDHPPPPLILMYAKMYIGGGIVPLPNTVGSAQSFHGCIADLTVNGQVMNFANTTLKRNEVLGKCVLDAAAMPLEPDVHTVPELPPLEELPSVVTSHPEIYTENPFEQTAPPRGDGGSEIAHIPNQKPEEKETEEPEVPVTEIVPRPTEVKQIAGLIGTVPPTTPKSKPKDGCALPRHPPPEDETALRFGMQGDSRIEYKTLRGKHKKSFEFLIELKTAEENGVIFFTKDDLPTPNLQYVALMIENGHVIFSFRSSGDRIVIKSDGVVNDNQWHIVTFSRDHNIGTLKVDDSKKSATNGVHTLNFKVPLYLGSINGVDRNLRKSISKELETVEPFKGCIRAFNMNNKPMEKSYQTGIIPCSDNIESGTFFAAPNGLTANYIKLKDKFKVGQDFNFKLDIKARHNSGVLVAVHGRKDFLVLEMLNGNLKLTVENGAGPFTVSYRPKTPFFFCDGQWHHIQVVKSKNVATLSVDNEFTQPQLGDHQETSTDTGSALFLGGHRFITRVRGINSRTSFVGCIKNVSINNEPVELQHSMVSGNVTVGSCRTD